MKGEWKMVNPNREEGFHKRQPALDWAARERFRSKSAWLKVSSKPSGRQISLARLFLHTDL